ncbi:hypothetical protein EVAR_35461_1 [Eumeta japonica]|uniref:Uncharacterized protein n=1 Tax=Eumeta variegata TaxID=151549 RepID=A0A4C1XM00_EUMVA|nr:hypothetical protein EVAR_35461_1 [Eumeta japonica]
MPPVTDVVVASVAAVVSVPRPALDRRGVLRSKALSKKFKKMWGGMPQKLGVHANVNHSGTKSGADAYDEVRRIIIDKDIITSRFMVCDSIEASSQRIEKRANHTTY